MKNLTVFEMHYVNGGAVDYRILICIASKFFFNNPNAWLQCIL